MIVYTTSFNFVQKYEIRIFHFTRLPISNNGNSDADMVIVMLKKILVVDCGGYVSDLW